MTCRKASFARTKAWHSGRFGGGKGAWLGDRTDDRAGGQARWPSLAYVLGGKKLRAFRASLCYTAIALWLVTSAVIALGHRPGVRTAVFGAANLGSNPSVPARVFADQTYCLVCFFRQYYAMLRFIIDMPR